MSIPPPPPAPRYRSARERNTAIKRLEREMRERDEQDRAHGYSSPFRWNSGPHIMSAFPLIIR